MPLTKERNAEPIPGYRLLEPLGRGGFGFVWKCEAPGGLYKAIKFVAGDNGLDGDRVPAFEELEAIQRIKALRHPFLLSMERVEVIDDELVIVMELADRNLLDLFHERRAAGQTGIPRAELLGYLREAADVLDLINLRHGLQHLDIKPANLFLISDHVKVADFGLVNSLSERPSGGAQPGRTVALGGITPLYAAPEVFQNRISESSDQYSLAIVYQELFTGTLPFQGLNSRQLMLQHTSAQPNLQALPESDRPIIARALSKDPQQRFGTCMEFIQALLGIGVTQAPTSAIPVSDGAGRRAGEETRNDLPGAGTQPTRPAQGKYLPDYQFITCQGRSPHAETWEATTTDGRRWLVRFLFGVVGRDPRREHEAVARLQGLKDPILPALHLLPGGPGCLIAVTELVETTLRSRFQEARVLGAKGLPRRQLLDWLWNAGEALDELSRAHGLHHLSLHPRQLQFKGNRLQVADFGLVSLLWHPAGLLEGQIQPRYAAPELSTMRALRTCDPYSLAVIYQEMLTGTAPFRGRRTGAPTLDPLPPREKAVIARALDADPEKRFTSCIALLEALEDAGYNAGPGGADTEHEGKPAKAGPHPIVAELLANAANRPAVTEPETWLTTPEGEPVLRSRFAASLPPSGAHIRFEGFRKQWNGEVERSSADSLLLRIGMPTQFWKRLFGRSPGLLVEITWTRPRPPAVPVPEVTVHIKSADKGGRANLSLLKQLGPVLLENLRSQLQGHPERRMQERRVWTETVEASFLLADGQRSEPITCHGKDISLTGMGLYLPCTVPGTDVQLNLTSPAHPQPVVLAGKCVRVQRCGDDWFEAGILFETGTHQP
jgi:serine/threonine protein kinase